MNRCCLLGALVLVGSCSAKSAGPSAPAVASAVVDSNGLKRIGDWINSIASCPL
jgi:hypothetical protein